MSILAVAGASGVGKSTFMRAFLKIVPASTLLTSTTTRGPRNDDIREGDAREYEYVNREKFKMLADDGEFLDTFGEEYKTRYGTRAALFEEALMSERVYLAALFVPGVELFFDEAFRLREEERMHGAFLDLKSEEERLRRLDQGGGRDAVRYEPELEKWRNKISKTDVPFLLLDTTSDLPETLVHKAIEYFGFGAKQQA